MSEPLLRQVAALRPQARALLDLLLVHGGDLELESLELLLRHGPAEQPGGLTQLRRLAAEVPGLVADTRRLLLSAEIWAHRAVLLDDLAGSERARAWAALPASQLPLGSVWSHTLRERLLRLASKLKLLGGASPQALRALARAAGHDEPDPRSLLLESMPPGAAVRWLEALHPSFRELAIETQLVLQRALPRANLRDWLDAARPLSQRPETDPELCFLAQEHAFLCAEPLNPDSVRHWPVLQAWQEPLRLAQQEPALGALVDAFDRAMNTLNKGQSRALLLPGMAAILHLLALHASAAPAQRKRLELLTRRPQIRHSTDAGLIRRLCAWLRSDLLGQSPAPPALPDDARLLERWLCGLLQRWRGSAPSRQFAGTLEQDLETCREAGWRWMAGQLEAVLDMPGARPKPPDPLRWVQARSTWERRLQALVRLLETEASPADAAGRGSRLQIRLARCARQRWSITALEQRPTRAGDYGRGRPLRSLRALETLLERLDPAADADRRLVAALQRELLSSYSLDEVDPDSPVWPALVGHPQVFVVDGDGAMRPVEVVQSSVAVLLEHEAGGQLTLKVDPPLSTPQRQQLRLQDGRLEVYVLTAEQAKLATALGEGLRMPAEAGPRLAELLPLLSSRVPVRGAGSLPPIDGDPRPLLRLAPHGEGLDIQLLADPCPGSSVEHPLGEGPEEFAAVVDGRPRSVRRALARERQAREALLRQCPLPEPAGPGRYTLPEAENALRFLEALQSYCEQAPDALRVQWPAGAAWHLQRLDSSALRLRVTRSPAGFSLHGRVATDDGDVLALAELLRRLPSAQGRYIAVDGGRFLVLSKRLKDRLEQLQGLADEHGELSVGLAAAPALLPLLDPESELDLAFRAQIELFERARRHQPVLPRLLQAELRDYQREGYRWMARLAMVGAGACLADDMGLGKTVQALALLLARAGEGPALVVAPTSLVGNWRSEARRFAPSLEVQVYADGDRATALDDCGPGRVLLCSYGLLAQDAERFAAVEWATLILDEAQAIKNPATQRFRAVRALRAAFRLALSGTPVENHLGELWALMRILNPGLLGSREAFQQRFVRPIEADPRSPRRELLKRLIAPFVLRRTKAEVLEELPERTEITLRIVPSEAEMRLYAALRRQALDSLDEGDEDRQRLHILAALTRLRRAACDPALVAPELAIPSSKRQALRHLVEELRENRHRALVFSQFTDLLERVGADLDAAGIAYQYLDGATPPKAREAAVAAFQRGEGDLFLLSLKAGGVGLNLTAADYVIHLDPWWNPAAEAQATDRAHRIGQTRPVTVYRIVMSHSIEERILELHGSKRELAESLLGDRAQPERLDAAALRALLGERDG